MRINLPAEIRFVFFDLGNVLLSFSWEPARQALAAASPFDAAEVDRRFRELVPWRDFEFGRISEQEFFEKARQAVEFSGNLGALEHIFCNIFQRLPGRIRVAELLADQATMGLGLLSNTNAAHIHFIEQQYPDALAPFDLRLYSHELGLRKPDPAIYSAATAAARCAAGNILFIDDLAENVQAARDYGWQAMQLLPEQDLLRALHDQFGTSP